MSKPQEGGGGGVGGTAQEGQYNLQHHICIECEGSEYDFISKQLGMAVNVHCTAFLLLNVWRCLFCQFAYGLKLPA